MSYNSLFGPVPSRRLGVSLGVDLVPYKVCTFNCVYCEVGETTNLTTRLDEYVSTDGVVSELDDYLQGSPALDYITFSGSGEPLLNKGIAKVIDFLKGTYPQYKLALLTNASLLCDAAVRDALTEIDVILPSLDAATEEVFQKINRPHKSLKIRDIIEGLIQFQGSSSSEMWLEVFILPGYNDLPDHLERLKEALLKIAPHKVQLNTLDRPGTLPGLQSATYEDLVQLKEYFSPLPTEITSSIARDVHIDSFKQDIYDTILQTIRRRPCTDDDLCSLLGLHRNELNKYIQVLHHEKKITREEQARGAFWRSVQEREGPQ